MTIEINETGLPYDWSKDSTPEQRDALKLAFLELTEIERLAYALIRYDNDFRTLGLKGALERCNEPRIVEFVSGKDGLTVQGLELKAKWIIESIEKKLIQSLVLRKVISPSIPFRKQGGIFTTIMCGLYDETTKELRGSYPVEKHLILELMEWQRQTKNMFSSYLKNLSYSS